MAESTKRAERLAAERWINEGGRLAPDAVIERELRAADHRRRARARPHVLIAGGGVAGLETLLALRALAGDRVDITLVAPELRFINRSMAVVQPFRPQRVRGVRMQDVTAEHGARWHRAALDRVEHERRVVVTKDGDQLPYDVLVLALGARPEREWHSEGVLTFHDDRDGPAYRLLLHRLREDHVSRLAFVKPAGASWPLPLYDLALMTAAECAKHDRADVELSLITPEEEPLGMFGAPASAAVARLLDERGVSLYTSSFGVPGRAGSMEVSPGGRRLAVDRIVASVGVDIDPQPFRPVLRGVLLTGAAARYLRADISGCVGDDSVISRDAPWWPPNKLSARYLAPYLSLQTGEAADVMPQRQLEGSTS
jgi:NADPH-dependent 2,4-dienoyl-CoA reductase/sulfur reductase-like enzyme